MGSRATQAARLAGLEEMGVSPQDRARIKCPIGLIHASRDPDTLALSAFVEAVDSYNRTNPTEIFERD
jgi:xanthine dehydrogenase accessory factor